MFTALDQATRGTLPKGLKDLEMLFGQNQAALRKLEEEDPTAFFNAFIQKLGETQGNGSNYYTLLKDLSLQQRETLASIKPLADNYQSLSRNLDLVAMEAKYATAQNREFGIFLETLDSKVKLLNNSWGLFQKDLGSGVSTTAKSSVDLLTAAINGLDAGFKALSPEWQSFITSEGIVVTSILGLVAAFQALRAVIALVDLALLTNPLTLLIGVLGTAAAAYLSFSGTVRENIELTQDEATKMAALTSGTKDAAVAMENLNRTQAENIRLALSVKLDETKEKMIELSRAMAVGDNQIMAFIKGMAGLGDATRVTFEMIHQKFAEGDHRRRRIQERDRADHRRQPGPGSAGASDRGAGQPVAGCTAQGCGLPGDDQPDQRHAAHRSRGRAFRSRQARTPEPAHTFTGDLAKTKKAGSGAEDRARETQDFLRNLQEREAGMQAEIAALDQGTEAWKRQQQQMQINQQAEQMLATGERLHIPNIQALVAAYKQLEEQREAAKNAADAKDEVAKINEQINAWQHEHDVLGQGVQAWKEYQAAAKIDPQIEAFTKRLEQLGMEKSQVDQLAAAYRAAAASHEKDVEQEQRIAKQEADDQKRVADEVKSTGNAIENALEGIAFKGESVGKAFREMVTSISKDILKKELFEPVEKSLTGELTGQGTVNGQGAGSGQGTGAGGITGMFGSAWNWLFGGSQSTGQNSNQGGSGRPQSSPAALPWDDDTQGTPASPGAAPRSPSTDANTGGLGNWISNLFSGGHSGGGTPGQAQAVQTFNAQVLNVQSMNGGGGGGGPGGLGGAGGGAGGPGGSSGWDDATQGRLRHGRYGRCGRQPVPRLR